jgi:hypothetical protein
VAVSGTVTVGAARVLGERKIAIQDDSGGIFVRLPAGFPLADVPRGAIVQVSGTLAAPYGNLELRPDDASDVSIIGSGGLPAPTVLKSDAIAEAREGQLATLIGTVVSIDRRSSGALSVAVRDDKGTARVYIHAPLGIERTEIAKRQRMRFTGIVGQRASRSGADDGHRIWPRGRADIELLADGGPGASPPPGDDPGGPPKGKRPPRRDIRKALPGKAATILGVVTSARGLIDSEGRRVTVEDRSGAILVRYPANIAPHPIGTVIRAWGDVETWFGATQLEADEKPRSRGQRRVSASTLRRPPEASDEWRLVAVGVRITDVERDGETWRAEATLGSAGAVPIVGLARSGISADAIEEGRTARIVGIVRRAHPSASDQRFAIAPRSAKDVRLGRAVRAAGGDDEDDDGDDDDGSAIGIAAVGRGDDGLLIAGLGSLDSLADRQVRVGGRLERIAGRQLTLRDDTGSGAVRAPASAVELAPALALGEVLNVSGVVRRRGNGTSEVVVTSVADIRRAASLAAPEPQIAFLSAVAKDPATAATPVPADRTSDPAPDLGMLLVAAAIGLLFVAGAAGAAAWLLLRRSAQPKVVTRAVRPVAAGSR